MDWTVPTNEEMMDVSVPVMLSVRSRGARCKHAPCVGRSTQALCNYFPWSVQEIPGAEARIERQRSDNEEVYEMLIRSANSDKPAWQPDYKGTREESRQGNHKG